MAAGQDGEGSLALMASVGGGCRAWAAAKQINFAACCDSGPSGSEGRLVRILAVLVFFINFLMNWSSFYRTRLLIDRCLIKMMKTCGSCVHDNENKRYGLVEDDDEEVQ